MDQAGVYLVADVSGRKDVKPFAGRVVFLGSVRVGLGLLHVWLPWACPHTGGGRCLSFGPAVHRPRNHAQAGGRNREHFEPWRRG